MLVYLCNFGPALDLLVTKLVIKMLHLISTSSRKYDPYKDTPSNNSTGAIGLLGMEFRCPFTPTVQTHSYKAVGL